MRHDELLSGDCRALVAGRSSSGLWSARVLPNDLAPLLGLRNAFVATLGLYGTTAGIASAAINGSATAISAAGASIGIPIVGAVVWHLRGREALDRIRSWWLARGLGQGGDAILEGRVDAAAAQGAVGRLVDPEKGIYLVRREGARSYQPMDEAQFGRFRAETAAMGKVLTLITVEGAKREVTVTRYEGGLLHGASPDCPAVSRFVGGREKVWYYDQGHDVTARVQKASLTAEIGAPSSRVGPGL